MKHTLQEWIDNYGLVEDDSTDVDDVEGEWEDVTELQ